MVSFTSYKAGYVLIKQHIALTLSIPAGTLQIALHLKFTGLTYLNVVRLAMAQASIEAENFKL